MADFKDKCTIIGPTIAIRGKVKADEDLVIRGRIDASISSTKLVHVDKDGVVKANVEAESVLISGVVVGDVTATARVELMGTARVVGDIASPLMVINDGARLRGKIDMPGVDKAMQEKYVEPPKAAVQPKPAAVAAAPAPRPIEPVALSASKPKPADPAIPRPITGEKGTEPTAQPKGMTVKPLEVGGRKPGTVQPVTASGVTDGARKPLPGVDAKPAGGDKSDLDIDAIVDSFGIEPEVEEIEMGDDQELLSIYDVDNQNQEPTQVGGNPISAKKN
ncbi:MAG TPA: polymer-forming cytoskeletal protein [Kofleriaceae bacterium]|nr:polymer-forming cytoskeletal protein [Kofleriaceae bacterium]